MKNHPNVYPYELWCDKSMTHVFCFFQKEDEPDWNFALFRIDSKLGKTYYDFVPTTYSDFFESHPALRADIVVGKIIPNRDIQEMRLLLRDTQIKILGKTPKIYSSTEHPRFFAA